MNAKQAFVGILTTGCLIGAAVLAEQALQEDPPSNIPNHACRGPDSGEVAMVVTIPANESVDVFHHRAGAIASIIEFCIRDAGSEQVAVGLTRH